MYLVRLANWISSFTLTFLELDITAEAYVMNSAIAIN